MSDNQFGHLRFTSFGKATGRQLAVWLTGRRRAALEAADIQRYLDRRKPGQNRFVTQRREADEVEILSGVFEGQTTGTPIGLLIRSKISARIMARLPVNSVPAMRITPIRPNMAF